MKGLNVQIELKQLFSQDPVETKAVEAEVKKRERMRTEMHLLRERPWKRAKPGQFHAHMRIDKNITYKGKGGLVMEHTQTSSENFTAALKLLEEAAKQKKDELRAVMSDKYTNLRSLILEKESSLMKSFTTAKDQALEMTAHVRDASVEKAREIAGDVDKNVHQNPWPYIGGAAVIGVLLGYILGRNRT